jgi:peroxiredoxin/tetratricopeptide (TPR) repeat protein
MHGKCHAPFFSAIHPGMSFQPTTLFFYLSLVITPAMADPEHPGESVPAGHSHEGEAFNEGPRQKAMAIDGTGEVNFPIQSTSPAAQGLFHQGIGQLHGFWYFEAERTFRQIAALDPTCAMAYWGMAMANWENPKRATEFINKAMALREHAGAKHALWIEAQHRFHTAAGKDDVAKRRQLIRDLEGIIHAYPDDIEAKAFLACRIWQFSRLGIAITSYESVDALLQQVLAKAPLHPAHHYRIHLWDQEKAERALDSAALLARTAPAIAHMWHMPGHIYSKLHRYDDSAWHQQASSRVDHRWMLAHRILPDQIHNYVHNQEWLIRNLQMMGDSEQALMLSRDLLANPRHPTLNADSNNKSSVHYGRLRHLETLEQFELWDIALKDLATGDFSTPGNDDSVLKAQRLTGIAHFSLGHHKELKQLCDDLSATMEKQKSEKSAAEESARTKAQKEKKNRKAIDQAVADAGRKWNDPMRKHKELSEEMQAHLALLEKRTPLTVKGIRRAKHVMARLHLQIGEKDQALRLSKEAVDEAPQQTLPLAARVEILHATDDKEAARAAFTQLQGMSASIDLKAPPFARLASIAKEFGAAADWRNKTTPRADVGTRPSLDSLGPLHWTPPPAPDFSLPQADGKQISLASFKGKPVVVLFYLGHGCLHCIEQLNGFAPQYQAFQKAGIEIIAISTDPVAELRESQNAYTEGGNFPFAILADPSQQSFQSYRAYDDFEKKPLHGTFLIDPQGRVLWQDIAAEPFAKPDFLLKEAVRLLEKHRTQ